MKFAKRTFTMAGIWGVLVLPPLYFMEHRFALEQPPAITHPEFYYGYIGVGLACQVMFLIIGSDPVRYRLMMIPAMIEKFSFVAACVVLRSQGRVPQQMFAASMIDLLLGILFIAAFLKTAKEKAPLARGSVSA